MRIRLSMWHGVLRVSLLGRSCTIIWCSLTAEHSYWYNNLFDTSLASACFTC